MTTELVCRAPHPAWRRDPGRFGGRIHGRPLPVTLASDSEFELVKIFCADEPPPIVKSGYQAIKCASSDCGAVHLFRVTRT